MSDQNDDVGYGKPPKSSRFKAGQSGNPKGRPKHASFRSELVAELNQTIELTDSDGQIKRISKQRALIKTMMASALRNEKGAIAAILMSMKVFGVGFDDGREATSDDMDDLEMVKKYVTRLEARKSAGKSEADLIVQDSSPPITQGDEE